MMTSKLKLVKIILFLLTVSLLVSLILTTLIVKFGYYELAKITSLYSLTLGEETLFVNYTIIVLTIIGFVFLTFLSLLLFILAKLIFTKILHKFFIILLWLASSKLYMAIFQIPLLVLLGLVIGVSVFGFFWENSKMKLTYRELSSNAKKDRNVILIVIDALRADHLGCYGYERDTTPYIDAFAKEGVLFKNCYAQATWTKPSVASILTSTYPGMHGMSIMGTVLNEKLVTIAEILSSKGYLTYGYVASPVITSSMNFNKGFDFFDDYQMRDRLYCAVMRNFQSRWPFLRIITQKEFEWLDRDNIKLANQKIIPWIKRYRDENFFMYIHYMDPHDPYSPPRAYRSMFSLSREDINLKNMVLYDGEIRFVNDYIYKLFKELKSLGIYDKTLIIITSDHGEAFGEHNVIQHGQTVYQEEIKIPLIIESAELFPPGRIIEDQVRSIDIMPTILDVLDVDYDVDLEGRSLLPLVRGGARIPFCEDVYVEQNLCQPESPEGEGKFILKGIVNNNEWKYIFTDQSTARNIEKVGREEIYNIREDPKELNNLIKQKPEILKILRNKLDSYIKYCQKRAISFSQVPLDKERVRKLKSLGYLQ